MGLLRGARSSDEAFRLAPNDPANLDRRGFTYVKLGRFEQAITDYDARWPMIRAIRVRFSAGFRPPRFKMILKAAAPTLRRRKCSTPMSPRNLLATDLASEPQASRVAFALGRRLDALRHIPFADWALRLGPGILNARSRPAVACAALLTSWHDCLERRCGRTSCPHGHDQRAQRRLPTNSGARFPTSSEPMPRSIPASSL